MKLSEPQKRVLTMLFDWGLSRVHTDLGAISRDSLDDLYALEEHGLLRCLWGPWSIVFSLTPKGREIAKNLLDAQGMPDGTNP